MTSYSSIILDYLGADVAANRPVSLNIAPTALGLYTATDTGVVSAWYGAAWHVVATEGASVSQIVAGAGLSGGTITTSGTIALGTIAAGDLLGNPGSVAAVPSGVVVGSGLTLSAGGTLTAGGGAGSVTSVVAGSGLSGGTITSTGTIALGTIAAGDLLGNPGSVAAVPSAVAIGSGLSLSALGTLSSTGSGGTMTEVVAGTGLTGGTITAAGTIALDPLGNALAINSGTIDYNQTPTAFSASRTLAAADNGTWLVDSSGGTVDVVVTTPTFAAGTKFTAVLQNNSSTHNVILRPGAGATIDGVAGDYPLHTFTSSRIGIDSTGAAWVAEPGNIFWQPGAGYVTTLGTGLAINSGTLSATGGGSANVALIKNSVTQVVTGSTNTTVVFGTKVFDTAGFWTSGNAFVIPAGVNYVSLSVCVQVNTAQTLGIINFISNGTVDGKVGLPEMRYFPNTNPQYLAVTTGPVAVANGDTLGVNVFFGSGTTIQVGNQTFFSIQKLG